MSMRASAIYRSQAIAGTLTGSVNTVIDTRENYDWPVTVQCEVPAGDSMLVEATGYPAASDNPLAVAIVWEKWPPGTVTADATSRIMSPVQAIRITHTGAGNSVYTLCY